MLTLAARLRIPVHVLSTAIEGDAVLLNTQSNKYYSLNEVGARFWNLLSEGKDLMEIHRLLLNEYEIEPLQLEKDLLELVGNLHEHNLIDVMET